MKSTITNKYHENYGEQYNAVIVNDRIACLDIQGRKVDFGLSEIEIYPDSSFGKEIIWRFRESESLLRDSHIKSISRRAAKAWHQKICNCEKAAHAYVSA
jgi:hypothetical protein